MRPTLQRSAAIESILAAMNDRDFLVSALGYLSRELYAKTEKIRGRCLYCMGSMGSVTPIALGVALAQPTVRVLAIEGDMRRLRAALHQQDRICARIGAARLGPLITVDDPAAVRDDQFDCAAAGRQCLPADIDEPLCGIGVVR